MNVSYQSVEKYMPSELDCYITLREVHIYRGSPPEILGRWVCTDAGGLTARGDAMGKP
jgi:hypothetical protein